MRKIDRFINQYSLSKTLQFKLIPYGETLQNFEEKRLLEEDAERSRAYANVKKYIDEYHKYFMNMVLSDITDIDVSRYAALFYQSEKTEADVKALEKEEKSLRKIITKALKDHKDYSLLGKQEMITVLLPSFLNDANELDEVKRFQRFTTYFTPFFQNRANMYTEEAQATGIAHRCINDNLPKFLRNAKFFEKIWSILPTEEITELKENLECVVGHAIEDWFKVENFAFVLSQQGITEYNNVIGGYTTSDGKKIQGLNEHINLYNQKHDREERLPQLKVLFKQILSDRESISFLPEKFESDDEVLRAVSAYYTDHAVHVMEKARTLLAVLTEADSAVVWFENGKTLSQMSARIFDTWSGLKDRWSEKYDSAYTGKTKKNTQKYEEEKQTAWKKATFLSLREIDELTQGGALSYLREEGERLLLETEKCYEAASALLSSSYADKPRRLAKNDEDIALLKNLLDAFQEVERFWKCFNCPESLIKDEGFYAEQEELWGHCADFFRLYDKVRNYVTAKPYSKDKIKLNFENPQCLGGWDRNKEPDYRTVLLRKGEKIYLGIMEKSFNKLFESFPNEKDNGWQKMNYKLLPVPNQMLPKVFFAKSNIDYFAPSAEIMRIYKEETFKKGEGFSLADCHKLISFYQDSIAKHKDWSAYQFHFKKPEEYRDISEFYRDVALQGYEVRYVPISEEFIEQSVRSKKLYLFEIYSKDFSPYSKGTPNLHTLYFKMLFDERNLSNVVYQLNGGAEMFYRLPSIREAEKVVHHKNEPIKNKNPHTEKATSTFSYDLVKDKRYTEAQFSLHIPITLNFRGIGNERINNDVREAIKECEETYVIGIDRGERHLIYITVVNGKGEIVEQYSLNQIINEYNGVAHKVDYHTLLEKKEKERLSARQNWTTVEGIKELKEGYISQVVHKICELVVKYDAVIAMEDLNFGFKTSRQKVEKQVYQKLEKMLIDKLNFLVDKKKDPCEKGGLLNAYQLTEKFDSFKAMGKQNGFIFYVPAWLTSKIDPTTGFTDLLRPRYTGREEAKAFIQKFDSIRYDKVSGMFEFSFDYRKFPKGNTDARGTWTVCTNGERIETVRDKNANGNFVSKTVLLAEEFKALFDSVGIHYGEGDLREAIVMQEKAEFFDRLMRLLRLTLQMRNSVSGTEEDYLISPVRGENGVFYDSRQQTKDSRLPENADANGAYNIARKALWAIEQIKTTEDVRKASLAISNKEWLAFAQKA